MQFFIDLAYIKNDTMFVTGWAAPGSASGHISYELTDRTGRPRELSVLTTTRPDLGYTLFRDPDRPDLGYFLSFPYRGNERVVLKLTESIDGKAVDTMERPLSKSYITYRMTGKKVKQTLRPAIDFGKKVQKKLRHEEEKQYREWFLSHRANAETLESERSRVFPYMPLFSVICPLYKTPVRYFMEAAKSVLSQSYGTLELILVNASPEDEELSRAVGETAESDGRVKVVTLTENLGISENTNRGLTAAEGEFVALLDHDDVLEPDALYEYVKALNEDRSIDLLYSDEDKITDDSSAFFYPNFKPDFAPEFLCSNNYVCHFLAIRTSMVRNLGGWRKEYDGAQDHDLILRVTETTERVHHVPRILYHWRVAGNSTAGGVELKRSAKDAGIRAVRDHYRRIGVEADVMESPVGGWYLQNVVPKERPLVSVLIPNKDHAGDLRRCIDSLHEKNRYENIEIIVIENNSEDPATFAYYEEVTAKYPDVRIVKYTGGFNYSAINNLGAREAKGTFLLLLNNDIEVDSPDFLESMAGYLELDGVGAVGAKLLYPDRTVQHAGVLVGFGGIAGHLFKNLKENEPGYMCRAITVSDVSAVTAACLLVRRSVFTEVGGLDESFAVAFNDVDFCLKIRALGYRIVFDAEAKLIHAESKSRGAENTPEKFLRFADESRRLAAKYSIAANGSTRFTDPYYNPNLSYIAYFEPEE